MVDSRRRASASLKVKYKSATVSQFVSQFGLDISHAGMFIKTKTPLEPGALIRLELQLSDGVPVIVGSGRVCWRRMAITQSQAPAGMGIEFTRLDPESRRFVDSIVDGREGRPSRFEQTEGAEHAAPSETLSSAPPSSMPPISGRVPTQSLTPDPDTPLPPPLSADPAAAPAPRSAPPIPPAAAGLFSGRRPRGAPSTDPFAETPTQGSFFAHGRSAGGMPSQPSQSGPGTGAMPAARQDAADKLVDRLFADAIPKSSDSEPVATDVSDDLITSEFPNPITTIPPSPSSANVRLSDPPTPALSADPKPALRAPSQFPAPLTSSASGFPAPAAAKSRALIVWVMVLLALCAAALFYLL
jgi:uncharacterized protein (TIGR02266 family)